MRRDNKYGVGLSHKGTKPWVRGSGPFIEIKRKGEVKGEGRVEMETATEGNFT